MRAKSGTGGLFNLSGDGERSGIIPTPWGIGERRIVACKSSMGTSRGAGRNMGISGSVENCGYHHGEGGGDGEGSEEACRQLNWRALSGRPFADGKPWVIPVSRQQRERENSDVNVEPWSETRLDERP
jgi:hypothetical protein